MEGKIPSRSHRKRPFLEDLDDEEPTKPPKQRKVRFPKGKKAKPGDEVSLDRANVEDGSFDAKDARLAALERAKRRNLVTAELFSEEINDASAAEVTYEDSDNFVEDGIQIEPFNLDKEREEGYFDGQGNYVEYADVNEAKDAWLDSVEVDPRHARKNSIVTTNEDDNGSDTIELSSEDIGMMKKRIASVLEPGETVLQALRRLKGGSNKRKEKMSTETQIIFDQLTEDANKLLDHGEYNVYHDPQEVFKREAEGYEKLALARRNGVSLRAGQEGSDYGMGMLSSTTDFGASSSILSNSGMSTSNMNVSAVETSNSDVDTYDIFADDDDNATAKPSSNSSNLVSGSNSYGVTESSSDVLTSVPASGSLLGEYVYDETSGYYYSSSSGYYYDPSTGLYCYAASGQWYSYNEETGSYDEIQGDASNTN